MAKCNYASFQVSQVIVMSWWGSCLWNEPTRPDIYTETRSLYLHISGNLFTIL